MIKTPDEPVRCRCGRSTFAVPGCDGTRTCSKCGYLVSFCKCGPEGERVHRVKFTTRQLSDRTRAAFGAAVVSALATLFAVAMLSSPLVAVLGVGIPLGLCGSFYGEWMWEGSAGQSAVPTRPRRGGAVRKELQGG